LIGANVSVVTASPDRASADAVEPHTPTDAGPLFDDRFAPDRCGLYRFERNGLTRLVAVNRPVAREPAAVVFSGPSPARMTDRASARSWLLGAILLLLAVEGWLAGRGAERFLRASALTSTNPLAGRRRILLGARVATMLLVAAALIGLPIPAPDR